MRSTLRLLESALASLAALFGAVVLAVSSDPTVDVFALIAVVGGLAVAALTATAGGRGGGA